MRFVLLILGAGMSALPIVFPVAIVQPVKVEAGFFVYNVTPSPTATATPTTSPSSTPTASPTPTPTTSPF